MNEKTDPKELRLRIDNFVLNCYHLAHRFHCDPEVFLKKPYSKIGRHLHWCHELDRGQRVEEEWQEKLAHG